VAGRNSDESARKIDRDSLTRVSSVAGRGRHRQHIVDDRRGLHLARGHDRGHVPVPSLARKAEHLPGFSK